MLHHFKGKDLLKLADFTAEEVGYLADAAFGLKYCLPGTRGEGMVDEVIESESCVFWDQGENRMHTEKAVPAVATL